MPKLQRVSENSRHSWEREGNRNIARCKHMAHSLREMEGFLKVRDDRATLHLPREQAKKLI